MPGPSTTHADRRGTFIVSSSRMERDQLERISDDPTASRLAQGLLKGCRKQGGFQVHRKVVFASHGGCEIDSEWNAVEQLALLSVNDDPRLAWLKGYTEEVELIRANASGPAPKLAGELGLALRHLAFHRALAAIHAEGYSVNLLLRDIDQTYPLPLLTQAQLNSLLTGRDEIKLVDNVVLAVGGDGRYVLIYVKGHSSPIFLEGVDEDLLHEQRKRGVRVRGTLEERDGKRKFLINPVFTLLTEQAELF